MSSGSELDGLVVHFRAEGFHSERRQWAFGDSVLIASQSEDANGIRVYKRSVYVRRGPGEEWVSLVAGIALSEIMSSEELKKFVVTLMRSSGAEYEAEVWKRSHMVAANE